MDNDCYIINRMYAGDYIGGTNIGHEIINLFSDDHGDNYIYVNSDGIIDPKFNDKVKGVILVRKTNSIHRLEVLGIAKVDENSQIAYKSKKISRPERIAEQDAIVDAYLAEHDVTYGGVSQSELFAKNKFRGDYENNHTITFKAKELLLPFREEEKKVYLSDSESEDPSEYQLEEIVFPKRSLRRYINRSEFPKDFDKITQLINDESLWDKSRKTEKLKNVGKILKDGDNFNYLDIICKQDDENVFSNSIAYFITNDKKLLKDFCREVLGIDNISDEVTIEREKSAKGSRIDIYIEDENNAVVIENKIKSEVNGTQERHDFTGELIKSQLEDYYNYVEDHAGSRKKKYFILMPNYHPIDLQKYKHSEKYTKIEYSDLVKFFDSHKYQNDAESSYYEDFKKALRRHSEDYYDDQYAVMKRRFIRRILECKT